jgi:hypothetical protein
MTRQEIQESILEHLALQGKGINSDELISRAGSKERFSPASTGSKSLRYLKHPTAHPKSRTSLGPEFESIVSTEQGRDRLRAWID